MCILRFICDYLVFHIYVIEFTLDKLELEKLASSSIQSFSIL